MNQKLTRERVEGDDRKAMRRKDNQQYEGEARNKKEPTKLARKQGRDGMTKSMSPGRSDVGIPHHRNVSSSSPCVPLFMFSVLSAARKMATPKVKRMNVDGARRTENPPRLIRGRQLRRVCFKACRARARASLAITAEPELIASKKRNI
jgi:hypothetical protein